MNCFKNILVAAFAIASLHPGDAAAPECPADGSEVCFSCLNKGVCPAPGDPAGEGAACPASQACKVVGGVATCMSVATVPGCDCGGRQVGCDGYNADLAIYCLKIGTTKILFENEDCGTNSETCSEGQCVDPSDGPCVDDAGTMLTGFFPLTPQCTSGVFCNNGEEVVTQDCAAGEYFNKAIAECEAFPPNPCTGCTKSKCPIISDCTKYAVCYRGVVLDDDESCDDGEFFDADAGECAAAAAGVCVDYEGCDFEPIISPAFAALSASANCDGPNNGSDCETGPILVEISLMNETLTDPTPTSSPSTESPFPDPTPADPTPVDPITTKPAQCTAADAGKKFPHETDCKKYYTCKAVSPTKYTYVDSTCSSDYVYNPDIGFCDLPVNVPGCGTE